MDQVEGTYNTESVRPNSQVFRQSFRPLSLKTAAQTRQGYNNNEQDDLQDGHLQDFVSFLLATAEAAVHVPLQEARVHLQLLQLQLELRVQGSERSTQL